MKKIYTLLLLVATFCSSSFAQELRLKWKTDTLFKVPESVLFDRKNNVLYIANIEGKSDQKDGKGFISKLSPHGEIQTLEWVSGLNAPKGMGMFKNTLYVADVDAVVAINMASGKITNRFEVEGAKFLNDITVSEKGDVYISDSATGKIHVIQDGKLSLYFESPELKRVNGLLSLKDGLYVAAAGTGINYKLSPGKKLSKFSETSQGADGVVLVGKNEYIVSSWGGEVYYVDANGKSKKMLDTKDQKLNTADIDFDPKTRTVFIPTFNGNSVMAYTFKK